MSKECYPQISKIPFEGLESKNTLAFHYYEPNRIVLGKPMKDWLKFAMAWWHTLGQASSDQFSGQTRIYPRDEPKDALTRARKKMDAGFEIMDKLGIEYYCFHDVDMIDPPDVHRRDSARMDSGHRLEDDIRQRMRAGRTIHPADFARA